MTRLETFLAWAESHRLAVTVIAGMLIAIIAWADYGLPDITVGFLYLIPVLLAAAALNNAQILGLAALCAYLRESFDPVQAIVPGAHGIVFAFNPLHWVPGSASRAMVVFAGFAATGFFVSELNKRRRMLAIHLKDREEQILRRQQAEMELRILIDTSPLAILTLDHDGCILLANDSARKMLGFERDGLQGQAVNVYLPILDRLLRRPTSGTNIRTAVECRGNRRTGDVFLAHVWLSTYMTTQGPALAAVIWDASENLRDREGAGLDSMMATSRVLIGALSHEIRNLASAAASAHTSLGEIQVTPRRLAESEPYQALGTLIRGLEKIASSGLRVASAREAMVSDLDTVLDETRIVIEPSLREAGIGLSWDVKPGLPLVHADHHSLLQVFVNLSRNSQEALRSCEPREVRISAALESEMVVIRFRDNGPGVPHPEELFRPFQAGAHSFGLGLYISRAILRSHGGGLRYEPEDSGSCFAVELWPVENTVEG